MDAGFGGGVLDTIKSRLGFGGQSYDDEYLDEYDEYEEGYDDYEDEGDAEPGSRYDRYDSVTTRAAGSRPSYGSTYTDRGAERSTYAPLVSLEDVKAGTRVPDSLSRDPLPARRRSTAGRASVGRASDYALSGTEIEVGLGSNARTEERGTRGYDSLFDSSSSRDVGLAKPASAVGQGTHSASGYDPYRAYEGEGSARHVPTRQIVVIAPQDYGEVESVARSLKAGDAVVLSLLRTQSQLSKRVLDFSFGVASALDASVDMLADKVFAITRTPLTDAEIDDLRRKGVM